jgi:hypothetical protein
LETSVCQTQIGTRKHRANKRTKGKTYGRHQAKSENPSMKKEDMYAGDKKKAEVFVNTNETTGFVDKKS